MLLVDDAATEQSMLRGVGIRQLEGRDERASYRPRLGQPRQPAAVSWLIVAVLSCVLLVLPGFVPVGAVSPNPMLERAGLQALYDAFSLSHKSPKETFKNWWKALQTDNCKDYACFVKHCQWPGIRCYGHGIIYVKIDKQYLTGTIPAGVSKLVNLE